MKILLFSLLALGATAFGADITDDNPGHLDNPAAMALVKKVLTDNKQDLDNLIVEYCGTNITQDKRGASNSYLVRDKRSGKAMKFTVAVVIEPVLQASARQENGD